MYCTTFVRKKHDVKYSLHVAKLDYFNDIHLSFEITFLEHIGYSCVVNILIALDFSIQKNIYIIQNMHSKNVYYCIVLRS